MAPALSADGLGALAGASCARPNVLNKTKAAAAKVAPRTASILRLFTPTSYTFVLQFPEPGTKIGIVPTDPDAKSNSAWNRPAEPAPAQEKDLRGSRGHTKV